MYVIRPQFFLPIISLLRNASMETLKYKSELDLMRRENYDITNFERVVEAPIPITFGDVVDTNDQQEFGILSGDDLMVRLSRELEVSHCIFLIGDAEGVLSGPPNQEGSSLISKLGAEEEIEGPHYTEIDVTGGIGLKIDRARKIASGVEEVWILDGRCPERVLELLSIGETRGTKILPY